MKPSVSLGHGSEAFGLLQFAYIISMGYCKKDVTPVCYQNCTNSSISAYKIVSISLGHNGVRQYNPLETCDLLGWPASAWQAIYVFLQDYTQASLIFLLELHIYKMASNVLLKRYVEVKKSLLFLPKLSIGDMLEVYTCA